MSQDTLYKDSRVIIGLAVPAGGVPAEGSGAEQGQSAAAASAAGAVARAAGTRATMTRVRRAVFVGRRAKATSPCQGPCSQRSKMARAYIEYADTTDFAQAERIEMELAVEPTTDGAIRALLPGRGWRHVQVPDGPARIPYDATTMIETIVRSQPG